jgi:hypothetical protein
MASLPEALRHAPARETGVLYLSGSASFALEHIPFWRVLCEFELAMAQSQLWKEIFGIL